MDSSHTIADVKLRAHLTKEEILLGPRGNQVDCMISFAMAAAFLSEWSGKGGEVENSFFFFFFRPRRNAKPFRMPIKKVSKAFLLRDSRSFFLVQQNFPYGEKYKPRLSK